LEILAGLDPDIEAELATGAVAQGGGGSSGGGGADGGSGGGGAGSGREGVAPAAAGTAAHNERLRAQYNASLRGAAPPATSAASAQGLGPPRLAPRSRRLGRAGPAATARALASRQPGRNGRPRLE
jgi:hypothetical protein